MRVRDTECSIGAVRAQTRLASEIHVRRQGRMWIIMRLSMRLTYGRTLIRNTVFTEVMKPIRNFDCGPITLV